MAGNEFALEQYLVKRLFHGNIHGVVALVRFIIIITKAVQQCCDALYVRSRRQTVSPPSSHSVSLNGGDATIRRGLTDGESYPTFGKQ